jgi:hypothetical protein
VEVSVKDSQLSAQSGRINDFKPASDYPIRLQIKAVNVSLTQLIKKD